MQYINKTFNKIRKKVQEILKISSKIPISVQHKKKINTELNLVHITDI